MASNMNPWPQDRLEHELESLSQFFRSFIQCPQEVRIRQMEGAVDLPMLMIDVVDVGSDDLGPFLYRDTRDINLMWYGPHEGDEFRAKNRALDWLTYILVRTDERHRGLIKVWDFSNEELPVETDYWIVIEPESVSLAPRLDEYGHWTISASFSYTVDHEGIQSAPPTTPPTPVDPTPAPTPAVTSIEYEVDHG